MGSNPKIPSPTAVRRPRRKSSHSNKTSSKPHEICRRSSAHIRRGPSVSDKLEALKNLVPSQNEEIKPEQLFRETADYIVLLKTQILVLQRLVDFYGSENQDAV